MKFRKKPVIIEAAQFNFDTKNYHDIMNFIEAIDKNSFKYSLFDDPEEGGYYLSKGEMKANRQVIG